MRKQLTDEQIADARRMRALNMTYPEIKAKLGVNIEAGTLRAHCLDVAVEGAVRTRARTDKVHTGKDGRTIRPFGDVEDSAIISWVADAGDETMAGLAKRLDRKRHSVAARILTLRKHGKIPAR